MSNTNTVPALQKDANAAADSLRQDASKAASKVESGADKLASRVSDKADDVAPKSEGESLLQQGKNLLNDTTEYVQKQASQMFGGEGSAASTEKGESISETARKYASDALNSVSGMLQKTGDKAGEAASDASKATTGEGESYIEQARKGASDLLSKAQEQLNSSSTTSK
ncbi:hypothetical protein MBRA1_003391 [Malassezia brasiliensis]|uniref:Uncharacterized protein n=1 Tax=Malassezia brasiliensis TaxID=1821822 RepID=A0AAF0DZC5_9BASI|nr:hypothetical protein MBRA1_003391 [Malassezia brasiliensis]